jgi:DNA-binding beta-propeller fold protein YncE
VYVSDSGNSRIQKFDKNGNFVTKWGSQGNGPGQFRASDGIAIDSSTGKVYVVDSENHRIQVFAPSSSTSDSNQL